MPRNLKKMEKIVQSSGTGNLFPVRMDLYLIPLYFMINARAEC